MKVGVPKEVKNHEYRVAITPIGVHELVAHGHEVFVEKDAGVGSPIPDDGVRRRGCHDRRHADDAVGRGREMVLKVKEPIAEEYERMREGQVLFTYLHLAADKPLTEELINRKVTGIAYETVQLPPAGCRCSTRCRRWPAAWRRRSGRTRCSRPRAAAACCSVASAAWPTPRSS